MSLCEVSDPPHPPSHLPSSSFRRTPLIQLHTLRRLKLDPDFRQGDEWKTRRLCTSPSSSFRRRPLIQLHPLRHGRAESRPSRLSSSNIVIPAKAGIQLHFIVAQSWTLTFVRVTSEDVLSLTPTSSFRRRPLIQLHFTDAQSWTLTFVRVTSEDVLSLTPLSSFRRRPLIQLAAS
jgi:hypothetical protein